MCNGNPDPENPCGAITADNRDVLCLHFAGDCPAACDSCPTAAPTAEPTAAVPLCNDNPDPENPCGTITTTNRDVLCPHFSSECPVACDSCPSVSPTSTASDECPRNCGQLERGGGTCRTNGRCTSCNEDRVLQGGRCYSAISCKGRRIQSGSRAGSGCRCVNEHCHFCNRVAAGDTCRVCRDGWYLLDGECVESCPSQYASSGVGSFKRRCADPFTCQSGRLMVDPTVTYGCKCATESNDAIADCQICEHRAGEHGQHCLKCNNGMFLWENRCERDNCDGLVGMIEYAPSQCKALAFVYCCTVTVVNGPVF